MIIGADSMYPYTLWCMTFHSHDTQRTSGTNRIEAFSDGVFAIICTLLILDVKAPHLTDTSTAGVLTAIHGVIPSLITFAFSFFALCVFWVNHHYTFRQLTHSDWPLLWHNCALLFWLTIVPFTTSFLGEYPLVPMVVSLYAINMGLAALTYNLMLRHALFHSNLVDASVSPAAKQKGVRRGIVSIVSYALAALIAPVFVWLAWAILLFVPLYYFVPQLWTRGEDLDE